MGEMGSINIVLCHFLIPLTDRRKRIKKGRPLSLPFRKMWPFPLSYFTTKF